MSEERKLIKQCKQRNPKAFDRLYKRYSSVLFGICLRYASDKSEAEDMLQEAFITVFNKIESYRYEGSFEGWLKRITVNTAINVLRKESRNRQNSMTRNEFHELKSGDADIIAQISENEILNCIQKLAAGYRTVFNMYVIEGYKHPEIAEALNISVSTSRSQLVKARKALIKEMKNLYLNT